MMHKRVAIVGAGASGIAAARQALDYDIEPVVFELSDDVGGLWRFKPQETDESSVMRSTIINTSKELTAYSDYVPPPEYPNYMHNRKLHTYFKMYVKHFNLDKYIRFKHKVEKIYRSRTYAATGRWMVEYKDSDSVEHLEEFDCVLMCNGHHTIPYFPPKWPGQEKFKGIIKHSHSYKDSTGYEDKRVAAVGCGNSGIDVAVELSRVCEQVYLIARKGTWVYPRNIEESVPLDLVVNRRITHIIISLLPNFLINWAVKHELKKRLNHEKFGLMPKHGVMNAHLTLNDELNNRLSSGTVVVKPNIKSFTENGIILADDKFIDHIDEVVLSTGYSFVFPLVEEGNLIPVNENEVKLYKYMYPPQLADHNTLAVIGLIQPMGSIMPISEIQARLFFNAFTGGTVLPSQEKMMKDIEFKIKKIGNQFVKSRRHTIQVEYVQYMDEIALLLGCYPSIWWYALTDPLLAWKLLFGPNAPYVYRLNGPKNWKGAREAVLTLQKRVDCGMINSKEIDSGKGGDKKKAGDQSKGNGIIVITLGALLTAAWIAYGRKIDLRNLHIPYLKI